MNVIKILMDNLENHIAKESLRIELAKKLETMNNEELDEHRWEIMSLIFMPEKDKQDEIWDFIKKYKSQILLLFDIDTDSRE